MFKILMFLKMEIFGSRELETPISHPQRSWRPIHNKRVEELVVNMNELMFLVCRRRKEKSEMCLMASFMIPFSSVSARWEKHYCVGKKQTSGWGRAYDKSTKLFKSNYREFAKFKNVLNANQINKFRQAGGHGRRTDRRRRHVDDKGVKNCHTNQQFSSTPKGEKNFPSCHVWLRYGWLYTFSRYAVRWAWKLKGSVKCQP